MLLKGNCLELLAEMPDNSVDSIVTDPPYELGFMGKSWDNSGIAYNVELWSQALRVLKPGGHLLAFGGSRTYHRLASAVEDAGFEIRDQIMWLYGSGFPKSLDVSKAIDKSDAGLARRRRDLIFTEWMRSTGITAKQINELTNSNMGNHYLTDKEQPSVATAEMFDLLRPHLPKVPAEIEEMVRQRTIESENFKRREVVKEDIRIRKSDSWEASGGMLKAGVQDFSITAPSTPEAQQWQGWGTALKPAHEPIVVARKPLIGTVATNVLTYGTGALNIDGSRVKTDSRPLRVKTGESWESSNMKSNGSKAVGETNQGRWPANVIHDGSEEVLEGFPNTKSGSGNKNAGNRPSIFGNGLGRGKGDGIGGDEGSAARFFYCAKASKSERNAGLEGFEPKRESDRPSDDKPGGDNPRNRTNTATQNFHPTVKPIALMRYLVKLVTPPNGTVLDPFLGSGTTAVAAILEGFNWMGCEMTEDYWPIIDARVAWAEAQPKTLL
jgi:DNA modification methylase